MELFSTSIIMPVMMIEQPLNTNKGIKAIMPAALITSSSICFMAFLSSSLGFNKAYASGSLNISPVYLLSF